MAKGNFQLPDNHFNKKWRERVRTWFDQPARKQKRRQARDAKAARTFPRPLDQLRPIVHPPTIKYNMKVRLGRGFTLEEIKEAGLNRSSARQLGIAVDARRRNHSDKSLKLNVQRLKEYKSKLIVFPRNPAKPKAGDSPAEETAKASQHTGQIMPPRPVRVKHDTMALSQVDTEKRVYEILRKARTDARLVGIREKKAKAKAETLASTAPPKE